MATKKQQARIAEFNVLKNGLFPDGNIPSMDEIQSRIGSGNFTVREGMIARLYKNGVPVDPFLLKDDSTKEFATSLQKAFSNPTKVARNIEGLSGVVKKLNTAGISLDSSFAELEVASRSSSFKTDIRSNIVSPIAEDAKAVLAGNVKRTTTGTRKLAKGAIPIGVLEGIMEGIGKIPDPVMRDAVVASMLGYRGTDLAGIVTTAEQAEEMYPARPYYNMQSGTMMSPDVEVGQGRKGKGPDKPLGPVMQQIMNRRHASAVDGELFPDMDTKKISAALQKYVYPNIDKETLALLKKKPSGYTDIRRIVASAIANQLGDPTAASEIISHGSGNLDDKIDKVMTGFYTDVDNLDSLEARRSALVGFEKLMADATNNVDAKSLGAFLNLDLPSEFNATYPDLQIKGTKLGSAVEITSATPEQIAAGNDLSAAKMEEQTQASRVSTETLREEADARAIANAANAEEVAAANLKTNQARADVKKQSSAEAGANAKQAFFEKFGRPITKGAGKVLKAVFPPAAIGVSLLASEETYASVTQQAEALGLPSPLAKTAGVVAGATEFLPITPSDVVSIAQAIPTEPSMLQEQRMRREARVDDEFGNVAPDGTQPVSTAPVRIPDPVPATGGMLSAGNAKQKVNLATRAAEQGRQTSMTGSFLNQPM